MSQIFYNFEHLITICQFHDRVDFSCKVVDIEFIDLNDVPVIQFPMILELFDNLNNCLKNNCGRFTKTRISSSFL